MKQLLFSLILAITFLSLSSSHQVLAQPKKVQSTPTTQSATKNLPAQNLDTYSQAQVTQILEQGKKELFGSDYPYQIVTLTILTGNEKGKNIKISHGDSYQLKKDQFVKTGEIVVISKSVQGAKTYYLIVDSYRLPNVAYIAVFFLLLVVFFARRKGIGALVGLFISFAVLMMYIVPRIAAGDNPLVVVLIGSVAISTITIFLAHGIKKRTTIAYCSTVITLALAVLFAYSFILITRLTGVGSEEAYSLQTGPFSHINFQGLFLGSIIIGVLGILDDVTTAQSAVIDELKKANPLLTAGELYERGLSVGQEHIASLVNTLILVYAGSAFPLFLAFTVISQYQPLWVTLNSQFIVEEVVRSLVGSVALILAVPITTLIASIYFGQNNEENLEIKKAVRKKKTIRQ